MPAFRRLAATVLTAAVLASPTIASAQSCGSVAGNLVQNCSFEGPTLVNGAHYPHAPLDSWTANPAGNVERWVGGFDGFPAYDGISHVELNVNAPTSLGQAIATTAGTSYDLGFWAAHRVNPGVQNSYSQIEVYVDNIFLLSTGAMSQGFDWQQFTASFVATDASTQLEFRGIGNGESYGNHLDNVSLVAASTVPEPGTYALMATGLVVLAMTARRRRRA